MDTLLIFRDTITVNALKVIDSCQPCIHEAETNEYDYGVVLAICGTIFLVALVVTVGFCYWQKARYKYMKELDKQNNEYESAQKGNDYQREKERNERDDARKEKEYQHDKERAEWDDATKSKIVPESLRLICDAAKDKDGKIDKDVITLLLEMFDKENGRERPSDKSED